MRQFFTYLAELPAAVNAAVVADENGDYTIYINHALSESARYNALCHELRHILLGHHDGEAAPGAERRADAPLFLGDIEQIAKTGLLPVLPVVEQKRLVPAAKSAAGTSLSASPPAPQMGDALLDAILEDLEMLEAEWDADA